MRMPPRCFKDFLGVGQDRRHILIWTGEFDFFVLDQLLFDLGPWCLSCILRNFIIRFRQPLVQKTQFTWEPDRVKQVLFPSVFKLMKRTWILRDVT